jgi:hypothetical protein
MNSNNVPLTRRLSNSMPPIHKTTSPRQDSTSRIRIKTKEIERGVAFRTIPSVIQSQSLTEEKKELNDLNTRLETLLELLKSKKAENDKLEEEINNYKKNYQPTSKRVSSSQIGVDLFGARKDLNDLSNDNTIKKIRLARSMHDLDQLKERLNDEKNLQSNDKIKISSLEAQNSETLKEINSLRERFHLKEDYLIKIMEKNWNLLGDYHRLADDLDDSIETRVYIELDIQSLIEKRNFELELFKLMKIEIEKMFLLDTDGKMLIDFERFYETELKNIKDKIRDDYIKINEYNNEAVRYEYETRYSKIVEEVEIQDAATSASNNESEETALKLLNEEFLKNKVEIFDLNLREEQLKKLVDELLARLKCCQGKFEGDREGKEREIAELEEQIKQIKSDSWNLLNFSKNLDSEIAIYDRLLNKRFNKYVNEMTVVETQPSDFSIEEYKESIFGSIETTTVNSSKNPVELHHLNDDDDDSQYERFIPNDDDFNRKNKFNIDKMTIIDQELKELRRHQDEFEKRRKERREREEIERQRRLKMEEEERERQRKIREQQEIERQKRLKLEEETREQERLRREREDEEEQERERLRLIREEEEEFERLRLRKLREEEEEIERQRRLVEIERLRRVEEEEREKQQRILREQQEVERLKRLKDEEDERERQRKLREEEEDREKQRKLREQQEFERKRRIEDEERREKIRLLREEEERERIIKIQELERLRRLEDEERLRLRQQEEIERQQRLDLERKRAQMEEEERERKWKIREQERLQRIEAEEKEIKKKLREQEEMERLREEAEEEERRRKLREQEEIEKQRRQKEEEEERGRKRKLREQEELKRLEDEKRESERKLREKEEMERLAEEEHKRKMREQEERERLRRLEEVERENRRKLLEKEEQEEKKRQMEEEEERQRILLEEKNQQINEKEKKIRESEEIEMSMKFETEKYTEQRIKILIPGRVQIAQVAESYEVQAKPMTHVERYHFEQRVQLELEEIEKIRRDHSKKVQLTKDDESKFQAKLQLLDKHQTIEKRNGDKVILIKNDRYRLESDSDVIKPIEPQVIITKPSRLQVETGHSIVVDQQVVQPYQQATLIKKHVDNSIENYYREQEDLRMRQETEQRVKEIQRIEHEKRQKQKLEEEQRIIVEISKQKQIEKERVEYELRIKREQQEHAQKQLEIDRTKQQIKIAERERWQQQQQETTKIISQQQYEEEQRWLKQYEEEQRRFEEEKRMVKKTDDEKVRQLEIQKQTELEKYEYERRVRIELENLEREQQQQRLWYEQQNNEQRIKQQKFEEEQVWLKQYEEEQRRLRIIEEEERRMRQSEEKKTVVKTKETIETIKQQQKRSGLVENYVDHCVSSSSGRKHILILDNQLATKLKKDAKDKLSKYALKHKANRYVSGAIGILETSVNGECVILENLSSSKLVNLKDWYLHRFVPDQSINIIFKFQHDCWLKHGDKLRIWSKLSSFKQIPTAEYHDLIADEIDNWGVYSKYSVTKLINPEGIDKAVLTQTLLRLSASSNNITMLKPAVKQDTIEYSNVKTTTTTTTTTTLNEITNKEQQATSYVTGIRN